MKEAQLMRISEVRQANPKWFERGTMQLFGDREYRILHSKEGAAYLVRRTIAWTDMLAQAPIEHWRLNPIGPDLAIENLVEQRFPTLQAVKQWLNAAIERR